jgi:hypothetical protein
MISYFYPKFYLGGLKKGLFVDLGGSKPIIKE